jgi:thymidylate synthase ThyX
MPMPYEVKILRDSVTSNGHRLTTWELTYPRFVHSELLTHRLFSRNSASSRAIPIDAMLKRVMQDPAMPVSWGRNQKGMQAGAELEGAGREAAIAAWLAARDTAVAHARALQELGAHKQIVNRVVEPWMWITVIVSATEFGNWFNLRCHRDAQPEIKEVADRMVGLYFSAEPEFVPDGQWHTPLIGFPGDEALNEEERRQVSVGRCARVSYLTHDGRRDPQADMELCDRLAESGHFSPFEHVAMPVRGGGWNGNFQGWVQFRKMFRGEHRAVYWRNR